MEITYKGKKYNISVGDTYERLNVVALVRYKEGNITRKGCICKCSCGRFIGPSRLYMLLSKELLSCGCYSSQMHSNMLVERNTIHGECIRGHRTKLYMLWAGMIDRCKNTNRADAEYYSLKGIEVYTDWLDFNTFREWALANGYKDGLSIERKDVNKGYNPDNCTFILLKDQNKNKSNSRILEYNGVKKNMVDWCKECNISWSVLNNRLNKGMSVGKALNLE